MATNHLSLDASIKRLMDHGVTRREALRIILLGGAGIAASPMLSNLAWAEAAPKLPMPRPNAPVTLPSHGSPIADGLKPESGTFTIFNYADYVSKTVLDKFAKKYDVDVRVTTFSDNDQAIAKLARGSVDVDVTELLSSKVPRAAAGGLLRPINHNYIPNLKANVWQQLQSPFYDVGSQYTIPYVCYTTGIGWRSDKVKEDIASMANPWSIFWKANAYRGYTGVMSEMRLAVGLALLYRGNTDLNTVDPKALKQASKDLDALRDICDPKVNLTEYQTLPAGQSWLHQAWSGDLLQAVLYYLPKGESAKNLQYWHAGRGKGPVQNDCWAIVANSKKPVLAHLWMNFILDEKVAYENFTKFLGYQPPITGITAERLVSEGLVPEHLRNTLVEPEEFGPGNVQYCALGIAGERAWQDVYSKFLSGA